MNSQIIEFFRLLEQYTAIAASFCTIISTFFAGVGYFAGKGFVKAKKWNVRKCLALQKKECKIVFPTYERKLYDNEKDVLMCDLGDINAASNIIDLIRKTGLYPNQEKMFYEETASNSPVSYNLFFIGGLLANKNTLGIFNDKFSKFKLLVTEESRKRFDNPNDVSSKWFMTKDKNGFFWGDASIVSISKNVKEKFEVTKDERYAIIVKLSKEDFGGDDHGDIYILFGQGRKATLAISKYMLLNYHDLYKKVKKKKHFFVAFKVGYASGEIDGSTFVDLTDVMFDKKQ